MLASSVSLNRYVSCDTRATCERSESSCKRRKSTPSS
jgi:hypothetical protein